NFTIALLLLFFVVVVVHITLICFNCSKCYRLNSIFNFCYVRLSFVLANKFFSELQSYEIVGFVSPRLND
ncbi:hypothetical protein QR98_0098920, partial [Sarcoptes scabiei]